MTRLRFVGGLLLGVTATTFAAPFDSAQGEQEPPWNPTAIKECDRACLVGIMDGYMNAIFKKDPKAVPALAPDVRMTENTGQIDVGEGVLWRSKRVTMETFSVRGGQIHHVEAAPFVTLPYGLGNGWTPESGR
jgi:hypothetical protein